MYLRAVALALASVLAPAGRLHAACNIIPPAIGLFRSTLASTDRPFARPGDWVTLSLDGLCHGTSPGFTGTTDNQVVTIVFTPPTGGPRNVVALATSCTGVDTATCQARPDVDTAVCVAVAGDGPAPELQRIDQRRLRFRFPNTDGLVRSPTDRLTLTGPVTVAVTAAGAPLPCALASTPCATQSGLRACADDLYEENGACGTTPNAEFTHLTALPPPNGYQGLCTTPIPPCQPTPTRDIRFTVDAAGNMLVPMDWRGVLVNRDLVPIARLLRGTSGLEAYEGRAQPVLIPGLDVLASYSPEGRKLPPLFDPQRNPNDTATTTFFGSADAPETILRIARHNAAYQQCGGGVNVGLPCVAPAQCPGDSCTPPECAGGGTPGAPCTTDAQCSGGECGPGLFDFSTRLVDGIGPVVLRQGACIGGTNSLGVCVDDSGCPGGQCGSFSFAALDPVPLDGIAQSPDLNAFAMEEAVVDPPTDLNGDGDMTDSVVKLGNRATGETQAIGAGGAEGRAVLRLRQPPFSFPAVAVDGDVLAFLEPEPQQAGTDKNGDGDLADTILRVFRLGIGSATEVTAGNDRAIDAAPMVNDRSLVASNGLVFFRTPEGAGAKHETVRASLDSNGDQLNGPSYPFGLSRDGRLVAFNSSAPFVVPSAPNGGVFVRDLVTGIVDAVVTGTSAVGWAMTPDGRFVLLSRLFPPNNGVTLVDRMTAVEERIDVNQFGVGGDGSSFGWSLSDDGRFVVFDSNAPNLGVNYPGQDSYIFLRDRQLGTTTRVDLSSSGKPANERSRDPSISGDGRFVSFTSFANNLVPGDSKVDDDVFVRDLAAGVTERVSVTSSGEKGNESSFESMLSGDGRVIVFRSFASNLVAGDLNGSLNDVLAHDRVARATVEASVSSLGTQSSTGSATFRPQVSATGRVVTFNAGGELVGEPPNGRYLYAHDLATGFTVRLDVSSAGVGANVNADLSETPFVSADGRAFAFYSAAANLVPGDTNNAVDVFVRRVDPTDLDDDITGDGDNDDTALQVLNTTSGVVTTLCPAGEVRVAGSNAAFLRPESEGPAPGCPAGPSLNGDADTDDLVVHQWAGGAVENLGRAATAITMSDTWIGALVSEAGQGGNVLNGDGDSADTIVQVHPVNGGSWVSTGQAADVVDMCGPYAAFITPEVAQGGGDLNGDGDADDRVLQVFNADMNILTNVGQAAEELVDGSAGLIAFRTSEAGQGGTDLNGDGDLADHVLQVYDATGWEPLVNSQQAVTPCRLEACDPRVPYRVLNDTVRFLTLEVDQGADLNGDGDMADLVVQVLNVRRACHTGTTHGACHTLAGASAGVCTTTANACASDASCAGGGTCFVPPGGCIRDLGTGCDPISPSCPSGQFCRPVLGDPGAATCYQLEGSCRGDFDCSPGAVCNDGDQRFQRLAGPLTEQVGAGGAAVLTGSGRCVENLVATSCTLTSDCEPGEYCDGGSCHREHGVCDENGDCPPGATCEEDLIIQTAIDTDLDEVPDPFDNCPRVSNVLQEDVDGDGSGDACDASNCPPVNDPRSKVVVGSRKDAGSLFARLVLPLSAYTGQQVAVRLVDGSGQIAAETVGVLAAHGPRRWQYRVRTDGLQKVELRDLAPWQSGFRAKVTSRRWFTAAQADRDAADTRLEIYLDGQCYGHVATRKR